jgi:putative CocE/NonD family hydrolase
MLPWDFADEANKHPTYDAFWKERAAFEQLDKIDIPVFSIGIWSKVELHLQGNIIGYQRINAPKKLLVTGSPNVFQAAADFNSIAFHEKYLLPFYDWCLKGQQTSYVNEPPVRYHLMGANALKTANSWPPENITYQSYYLKKGPTGSVKSLNDGALDTVPPTTEGGATQFNYPDAGWRAGVVTFGPQGPDTVARILTFTSEPLEADLEVVGPVKLVLYAASSNTDTDFIVKLSEQLPQAPGEQNSVQPRFRVVSKGWMKASHRELNPQLSTEYAPWYSHQRVEPLEPGKPYRFEVPVMPTANLFKKASRIRLELANGDSSLTDFVFEHVYLPNKIGQDTIFHSAAQPSQLLLPVVTSQRAEK